MTIKQRSAALRQRYGFTQYRLAQLMRVRQDALNQQKEGDAPMRMLLTLFESIGPDPFMEIEKRLGKFNYFKDRMGRISAEQAAENLRDAAKRFSA